MQKIRELLQQLDATAQRVEESVANDIRAISKEIGAHIEHTMNTDAPAPAAPAAKKPATAKRRK